MILPDLFFIYHHKIVIHWPRAKVNKYGLGPCAGKDRRYLIYALLAAQRRDILQYDLI